MKNSLIVLALFFFGAFTVKAQHLDGFTAGAVIAETVAASILKKKKLKTTDEWRKTTAATIIERSGRYRLDVPKRHIDFFQYANVCRTYISPTKKKKCKQKMAYLKESHDVVFNLLLARPKHLVRKGVGDQIWEKYASICSIIKRELEETRLKAEKDDKLKYLRRG